MILVLFAYCITGSVHGEKIHKSTVQSLMEQPTQFLATPLSAQGSYGDEYQACSSRVLQLANSAEILPRVASKRWQEVLSHVFPLFPSVDTTTTQENFDNYVSFSHCIVFHKSSTIII